MDRIDFINSINHNGRSVIDLVSNYFDQNMLLYDLVEIDDKISVIEDSTNKISFQVDNNNPNSILDLTNKISRSNTVVLYARPIYMNYSKISDSSIIITMSKL